MKKLFTLLIAAIMVTCFAGCGPNDDSSSVTSQTGSSVESTESTNSQTTSSDPVSSKENTNTSENINADIDIMLDFLTEAEEIYGKIDEIIDDYNDKKATLEETVAKLKAEQINAQTLISNVNGAEWKSELYKTTRSESLDASLQGMSNFFENSIKGLEEKNNALLAKADGRLNDYCSLSYSLFNKVKGDSDLY